MNREGEDTGAESLPRRELSVAKGAKVDRGIKRRSTQELIPNPWLAVEFHFRK